MDRIKLQQQVNIALTQMQLPAGITIRVWNEDDFPAIQRLSDAEGWPSPTLRPTDSLQSWRNAWPALVALKDDTVVGFVRALTDGAITMYIAELLVDKQSRSTGIGHALLEACHQLYPTARLDLLAAEDSRAFYEACGYRVLYAGMRKSYV